MNQICPITLTLLVAGLSSGSSSSGRKGDSGSRHLVFDDVVQCPDVESFNEFVRRYLFEHGLFGETRRRTYWALFYAWKGGK